MRFSAALRIGMCFIATAGIAVSLASCTDLSSKPAANSADPLVIKSPNDPREYRAITLDNGMEVLLVSDPEAKKAAASVSIPVGAMWDPMDYQGMAHYVEHLIHLGSEDFPGAEDYSTFLAQNGGSRNAYTALDETNYFFDVNDDAFEPMLDRFAGMFTGALLDPTYVEKEKSAVASEWSMRRESDGRAKYYISRKVLGDHPANRFATGNLDTLADKPPRTLTEVARQFYDTYYSAHLMKGVLLSSASLDELETLAKEHFSDIPVRSDVNPEITTLLDFDAAAGKLILYVPQDEERSMRLEFLVDDTSDRWRKNPGKYISYILGSEMPNGLASTVKSLGWASSFGVGFYDNAYGNYSLLNIDIPLTEEGINHREEITSLVLSYLEKLRSEGLDDRYVRELQTTSNNAFQFLEKQPDISYVSHLASEMQKYPVENAINAEFVFDGFDPEGTTEVLNQLVPERMRVWYVSKEEATDQTMPYYAGTYAVEPLALAAEASSQNLAETMGLALPALNSLLPESFAVSHAGSVPEKVISTPTTEIWVQGSAVYPNQPKGIATVHLNSPSLETPTDEVLLSLWLDIYRIQNMNFFEEAAIAGIPAGLSKERGLKLTVTGFTDKQPELLQKALKALRLSISNTDFEQAIDRYQRNLFNQKRSFAYAQLFPAFGQVISANRFPTSDLATAAADITLADLRGFIDNQLRSFYVRAYMFGNYDAVAAEAWSQIINDALPERASGNYVRSTLYQPQPDTTLDYHEDIPVDDVAAIVGFMASDTDISVQAANMILASYFAEQAFNQLRTEEQLGYVVSATHYKVRHHSSLLTYVQTNVLNATDLTARLERFTDEVGEKIADMELAEFERWKNSVLADFTKPPANLGEEAAPFLLDWDSANYDFNTKANLIAAMESISLKDFQEHYASTILGNERTKIVIQLRGKRFQDQPYGVIDGATNVSDTNSFHMKMPVQAQ